MAVFDIYGLMKSLKDVAKLTYVIHSIKWYYVDCVKEINGNVHKPSIPSTVHITIVRDLCHPEGRY